MSCWALCKRNQLCLLRAQEDAAKAEAKEAEAAAAGQPAGEGAEAAAPAPAEGEAKEAAAAAEAAPAPAAAEGEAEPAAAAKEAAAAAEAAPKSLQKAQAAAAERAGGEAVEGGAGTMRAQKDITLASDMDLRDRLDTYRNFLLYCMSGDVVRGPMGVTMVTGERAPIQAAGPCGHAIASCMGAGGAWRLRPPGLSAGGLAAPGAGARAAQPRCALHEERLSAALPGPGPRACPRRAQRV